MIIVIIVNIETAMLSREMQRNTKKCREMREKFRKNVEQCREMQINLEK